MPYSAITPQEVCLKAEAPCCQCRKCVSESGICLSPRLAPIKGKEWKAWEAPPLWHSRKSMDLNYMLWSMEHTRTTQGSRIKALLLVQIALAEMHMSKQRGYWAAKRARLSSICSGTGELIKTFLERDLISPNTVVPWKLNEHSGCYAKPIDGLKVSELLFWMIMLRHSHSLEDNNVDLDFQVSIEELPDGRIFAKFDDKHEDGKCYLPYGTCILSSLYKDYSCLRPRQIIEPSSLENKARILQLLDEKAGNSEDMLQRKERGINEDWPQAPPPSEYRDLGHEAVNGEIGAALEPLNKPGAHTTLFAHGIVVRFAVALVSATSLNFPWNTIVLETTICRELRGLFEVWI
ncbi:hypothetical protein BDP81DRAFT_444993 [Colletotrichum phormii]|uniref:Uncharacterized protein n=1 Tax=Colletotrichum phormii TaxID=359342 RepID=A0AAJ0EMD9_9PEZI|nr:uncharacterized protein BDP81DRAFT_444993 [Colletotrichum phormii]KAK1656492.1 hypothetical protein BDP81DRAFT_444993 [Colletotrichum phormii]